MLSKNDHAKCTSYFIREFSADFFGRQPGVNGRRFGAFLANDRGREIGGGAFFVSREEAVDWMTKNYHEIPLTNKVPPLNIFDYLNL